MPESRDEAAERARHEMVARQLRDRGITDERVLAAMGAVPREAFVHPDRRESAYRDAALPTAEGQTISQPWVVARMTELLRVKPGDRILEIGTGSGYQAAILAELGARVRSFERIAVLADTARDRFTALVGMTTPFGPTVMTRTGPTRWS